MTKSELRYDLHARLRALPDAERARSGEEIARRVWTLPEVAAARTLLLFASLPEEVPTDGIAREAWRRGVRVAYPRCLPGGRELMLHRVRIPGELRTGRLGIREPDAEACPLVAVGEIDAALVPGLAWDRSGTRLGRGGGFYDRLLAAPEWRGFRCGLFFAAQEVFSIPPDDWDAPLNAVVTEREVWRVTSDLVHPRR